jgi:hypothetical protein
MGEVERKVFVTVAPDGAYHLGLFNEERRDAQSLESSSENKTADGELA